MIIILFVLFINFLLTSGFFHELYFLQGKWTLRKSNDPKLKNKYTYFLLNTNNEIKIKTISNGIVKVKTSRTGEIKLKKNNNVFLKNYSFDSLKNLCEDNDINCELTINNVNSYSYSIIGIEIPQIRYKQNTYNDLIRKINIKHKDKTIYVTDINNNMYYLFDLDTDMKKTPYIEISITTLIINELFDILFSSFLKK
jgi:hypothetical protein